MVDGLAFLPVEEVSEGMHYLQETCFTPVEELFSYFGKTYMLNVLSFNV